MSPPTQHLCMVTASRHHHHPHPHPAPAPGHRQPLWDITGYTFNRVTVTVLHHHQCLFISIFEVPSPTAARRLNRLTKFLGPPAEPAPPQNNVQIYKHFGIYSSRWMPTVAPGNEPNSPHTIFGTEPDILLIGTLWLLLTRTYLPKLSINVRVFKLKTPGPHEPLLFLVR